ncbi:Ditrans,polycis-undecaprenyl-diphosphate synthase ((2E,6E)-farnesyl-diphosphate specific) [subsurface metagenome]
MATPSTMKKIARLPNHVAIIMDGNGRWAKQHGLLRLEGHQAGAENIRPIIKCLNQRHIKYVTLYGFSTENWNRPEDEVTGLLRLFEESINQYVSELHENGIKLRHLGHLKELPQGLQLAINKAIELTKNNTRMTLSFALNYGGRLEILDAVRHIIAKGIPIQNIDEGLFNSYLYTAGLPDVDLVIRTSGEFRTSNFLIWQAAYSEYYFTDILWPDFNQKELEKALLAYSQRQRRFGKL